MLFAILAILTYLGALLWITPTLARLETSQQLNVKVVFLLGILAVIFHSINVSQLLFIGEGQNFTIMNVGSLISVSISELATLALLRWKTI